MFPSGKKVWGVAAGTAVALLAALAPGHATAATDSHSCRATQLFVAPTGDDHADGSKAHPWRTVEHARDYIRDHHLGGAHMRCDIDVNLRAGDYTVSSTIDFGSADSGNNGHKIAYRSYDGPGKARLLGAKQVTGWQPYKGNIYRAKLDPSHPIYTLYENDQRATTARTPNRATDDKWAPYFQTVDPTDDDQKNSHTWLNYKPGDWNQNWDLHDAQVVIWSGGHWTWFTDTDPIHDVSWDKGLATLTYPTRYTMYSQVGSRYFLQNSLDFLDQAGEYYEDSQTGWLYYWPSTSIDTAKVMAPTVQTILSVAGSSPSDRAHDITFDGLALEYSDFMQWYRDGYVSTGDSGFDHKYPDYDRQVEMPRNQWGMVTLTNTRRINLQHMSITNSGYTAVFMLLANDHDSVSDSLLGDLGNDGIKVEGPYPGEGDIANHNVFTDNYIHDYGQLVPGDAAGVELMNSGHNEVSYSTIEHSARYAVSTETLTTAANADDYSVGNTFKYLRIAHVGLDSGDTGAFYAYGVQNFEPHDTVSTVSQVTIQDVNPDPSMPDVPPSGVHMDFGGCGFAFSDIQAVDVARTPYHGDTSCNTFDNNNWNDGFDTSKMQYDQIGVKADFPYSAPPNTPVQ